MAYDEVMNQIDRVLEDIKRAGTAAIAVSFSRRGSITSGGNGVGVAVNDASATVKKTKSLVKQNNNNNILFVELVVAQKVLE